MRDYILLSLRGLDTTYATAYEYMDMVRTQKNISVDHRILEQLREKYPNENHSRMFEDGLLEKYDDIEAPEQTA